MGTDKLCTNQVTDEDNPAVIGAANEIHFVLGTDLNAGGSRSWLA